MALDQYISKFFLKKVVVFDTLFVLDDMPNCQQTYTEMTLRMRGCGVNMKIKQD
jgi:hypothetical protein